MTTAASVARSVAVWAAIIPLAIANGLLREEVLVPAFGRVAGLMASGLILSAAIVLIAITCIRWIRPASRSVAWRIGGLWLVLTLVFESGIGVLQRKGLDALLEPYTFRDGNLWPLVLLATLAAPVIAQRWFDARQ